MGQELAKIKKRIKSVTGAYKVTSAMKLVSTVKLKSYRNKMLANRDYIDKVSSVMETLFKDANNVNSPFIKEGTGESNLYVIVSSTLGLCGSYNQNIFKIAESSICEKDEAIILGKKGITHFANNTFNKLEGFENYSSIKDESVISSLVKLIVSDFLSGKYKEIHFIYSKYVNPLVFKAEDITILPLANKEESISGYSPIFEPSREALIDAIAPFYIKNTIYAKLLESEVCEHAARSNAMENATKNAEDILDTLKIEFNKARQGAITQEIIEITSASNI